MRILLAEDDPTSALVLRKALSQAGMEVHVAIDGERALALFGEHRFDGIVTDWMMPNMDGLDLIRAVRTHVRPAPPILMVTALSSSQSRQRALDAGADEYLTKPVVPAEAVAAVERLTRRSRQAPPSPRDRSVVPRRAGVAPVHGPYTGVVVAASTGGPDALLGFFSRVEPRLDLSWFVVLHGPAWMLETFAERLGGEVPMPVHLATHGTRVERGHLYLCPGDVHTVLSPGGGKLLSDDGPPENYVKPAADPLLRSVARELGDRCVAVVLTGMGRDGALGCQAVHDAGGLVLAQRPGQAVAASMPRTVVEMGLAAEVHELEELAPRVQELALERAPVAAP